MPVALSGATESLHRDEEWSGRANGGGTIRVLPPDESPVIPELP
jgi:hypothetical protein